MPYTMKLKLDGKEIQMGKFVIVDFYILEDQFKILDEKMSKVYEITVGRVGSTHPPFTRSEFRSILRKAKGQYVKIVEHFFHQNEFDAFISQKAPIRREDVRNIAVQKILEQLSNISEISLYPPGYYILKTTDATTSYVWPVPTNGPAEVSDSLEDLELMMYMTYLADATPEAENTAASE